MKTLLSLCILLTATLTFAGKPAAVTDINAALEQAKQECAKVPDDKKEADENCKKVKEAAAS